MLIARDNALMDELAGVAPNDFDSKPDRMIFAAMKELHAANSPIDPIGLREHLGAGFTDVGGIDAISGLYGPLNGGRENVTWFTRKLLDLSMRRKAIAQTEAMKLLIAEAEDALTGVAQAAAKLESISAAAPSGGVVIGDLLLESLNRFKAGKRIGFLTGIEGLDRKLGGLRPKELTVLGALPTVGKTAFAVTLAEYIAKSGAAVIFFSVEMGKESITDRLLLGGAGITMWARDGNSTDEEQRRANQRASAIMDLPILVDDSSGSSIEAITAKARQYIRQYRKQGKPIGTVVIDHLHILHSEKKHDRHDLEVGYISWQCKHLAKDYDVPVLLLSQLNRQSAARTDPRPQMSDLRQSGDIEANADVIVFLHRPNMHKDGDPTEAWALIRKHRNGPTGDVELKFHGPTMRFTDAGVHDGQF